MIRAILLGMLLLAPAGEDIPPLRCEVAFPNLKFKLPVCITHPPDGSDRIFVVEQHGTIRWFENRPDVPETHLALDLSGRILTGGWEEGVLGLAFHPQFKENGFVFLQYSRLRPRRNVLSRFVMDEGKWKILPHTEEMILEVPQPYENHNGGMLKFGSDGYLYIGLGDGGLANDPNDYGQDLRTFLGKFLRIDVDRRDEGKRYAAPPDNPFVGRKGALPEIWSYGWRNPWGYAFDRKTGELWSGDVGQDKWEEINIVKKGGNYGWSVRESMHEFKGGAAGPFEEPLAEYSHEEGKSVTGGVVYRGRKLPAADGVYLYGDFVTGHVWGLRYDGKQVTGPRRLFTSNQVSCFGEDRDGEVYFGSFDGNIYGISANDNATRKR